ncbi:hypothetical protein V4Y02_24110, partial [Escherichia coli]
DLTLMIITDTLELPCSSAFHLSAILSYVVLRLALFGIKKKTQNKIFFCSRSMKVCRSLAGQNNWEVTTKFKVEGGTAL